MRHMHSNLMRPSRFQPAFDGGNHGFFSRRQEAILNAIMGQRELAVGAHGELLWICRRPAERCVDCAARRSGCPPDISPIAAIQSALSPVVGELPGEGLMCRVGLCHGNHA